MDTQSLSTAKCRSLAKVTARLLVSFLAVSTTITPPVAASRGDSLFEAKEQSPLLPYIPFDPPVSLDNPNTAPLEHVFSLRHIFHHGTYAYPKLHRRLDVNPEQARLRSEDGEDEQRTGGLRARSGPTNIQRLSDRRVDTVLPLLSTARLEGRPPTLPLSAWTREEVLGPNITDRETVISLALMSANAYEPVAGEGEWEDVKHGYNYSDSFGWAENGLRGHIFADENNSTIVIAIKGTSVAVFDGTETTTNDKENDNLFFSCCCGQGGHYLWRQVCDCMTSAFTCNRTCVVRALRQENRYYQAAIELYGNVTELYPTSNVWLTGHSLGGSTSALLGLTFGLPTVTFQSVPDALPASRLGLPTPPDYHPSAQQRRKDTGIYHVGHTADPVFMNLCNSATAGCTLAGYAFQSQCHTGQIITYDTVKDLQWRVSLTSHKIRGVIGNIIRAYPTVPAPTTDSECVDCFNWKYFESNESTPITSKSSTSTTSSTRTSTCKTPGWWGCLDESTTVPSSSSSTSTTVTTTATCRKYSWFGNCLDPIDTTATTSSTTSSETSTSAAVVTTTSIPVQTSHTATTTCLTPGLLYGCRDETTIPPAHAITAAPVV